MFSVFRLYAVIVVRVPPGFDTNTMDYDDVGPFIDENQPYVAAAWDNVDEIPDSFRVGDGRQTTVGGVIYTNRELSSNTQYAAFVRLEIVSDNPNVVII